MSMDTVLSASKGFLLVCQLLQLQIFINCSRKLAMALHTVAKSDRCDH